MKMFELVVGERYWLDRDFKNSSIVTLKEKGNIYCVVENDKGKTHTTMTDRLTSIVPEKEPDTTPATLAVAPELNGEGIIFKIPDGQQFLLTKKEALQFVDAILKIMIDNETY